MTYPCTAWPFADATCTEVTVAGLRALGTLHDLEELVICMDGSCPWDAPVPLPTLPKLRRLRFEGRMDAPVLDWIARRLSPHALRTVHLWLPGNEFDKTLCHVHHLEALPSHVELHLCCDAGDVPFAALRQLPGLVSLRCRYSVDVVVVRHHHALHNASLHSHTSMCAADVEHLASLPSLRILELYG